MRMNAIVAGVGMTRFGKHMETGLKALGGEAVRAAIEDSGVAAEDLEAAYVSNAMAGIVTGQECIRGQVILRPMGIGKIPVINIDNACGSASTAFHQACACGRSSARPSTGGGISESQGLLSTVTRRP